MQISMILDPDACIYDAANLFRTNERTDEQGDSRSWIVNSLRSHDRLGSIPAKPGGYRTQFVCAELSECSGLKDLWKESIYRIIVDRNPNH